MVNKVVYIITSIFHFIIVSIIYIIWILTVA